MQGAGNKRIVDLEAIRQNVRALRTLVPEKTGLLAVVKADAYGHGAVPVARAALEAGSSWLAVARVQEGLELREAGITAPILVLGLPEAGDYAPAARQDITLTVCTPAHIAAMRAQNAPMTCHLKLDTGMGRIGCRTAAEVAEMLRALEAAPNVRLTGAYTHLADADGDDLAFSWEQVRRFRELTEPLPENILRHCANSAAIHRMMPDAAFDLVRMGISLYGCAPVPTDLPLRPAMRWVSQITHIKELQPGDTVSYNRTWTADAPTRVATVSCGYGDGYHRSLSGRAQVLLRGHRLPLIGRVCMDQLMIDVSTVPEAAVGDIVTLMGRDGAEEISASELAGWAGTISYEMLLSSPPRVPREWLNP